MTRPASQREAALYLVELGLNDCQIGRAMGIPYRTIQGWRRPAYVPENPQRTKCPRCHGERIDRGQYGYLLGLYLGDGWLRRASNGVYDLQIYCCDRYIGLISEAADALNAIRASGNDGVGFQSKPGIVIVHAWWKHWPCLFPQHGPGPKHRRRIILDPWQQEIVERHPERFLRGLIHSDGWRGLNRVRGKNGKAYAYPRYEFTNESEDIRALFQGACDRLGIGWTKTRPNCVAVSRRADVARMDLFVGPKY